MPQHFRQLRHWNFSKLNKELLPKRKNQRATLIANQQKTSAIFLYNLEIKFREQTKKCEEILFITRTRSVVSENIYFENSKPLTLVKFDLTKNESTK